MKVLLTGCSGFIARHMLTALQQQGCQVSGLDRTTPHPDVAGLMTFHQGDLCDPNIVAKALDGCQHVIHLAAEHQDFGISESEYFRVNEQGTDTLVDAMASQGVRQLVLYSSVAVYGDNAVPSSEETPPAPTNPYGASKLAAEAVVERWAGEHPANRALVIRPAVVYGPWHQANMLRLMRNIDRGTFLQIGAGDNVKSIIYVENLVAATLQLAAQLHTNNSAVQVFNAADEPQLCSADIARKVADALGRRLPRFQLPLELTCALAQPLDWISTLSGRNLPITAFRIRKFASPTHHGAAKLHGVWQPPYSPDEGLRRMAAWYQTHVRPQP